MFEGERGVEHSRPAIFDDVKELKDLVRLEVSELRRIFPKEELRTKIFENRDIFNLISADESGVFSAGERFAVGCLVDVAKLPAHAKVLHAGSGWGLMTRELLRVRPDIDVINLDVDPTVLAFDQTFDEDSFELNQKVTRVVSDASAMALASNSVDAVVSFGVLRQLVEKDKRNEVLEEAFRVLKPGAVGVLGDVDKESLEQAVAALETLGSKVEVVTGKVEVFKATSFYFYSLLYAGGEFASLENFSGFDREAYVKAVDDYSKERALSPTQVLMELAGTEEKLVKVIRFTKP